MWSALIDLFSQGYGLLFPDNKKFLDANTRCMNQTALEIMKLNQRLWENRLHLSRAKWPQLVEKCDLVFLCVSSNTVKSPIAQLKVASKVTCMQSIKLSHDSKGPPLAAECLLMHNGYYI